MFFCHLFASMEKFEKEILLGVQTYTQCALMSSFQLSLSFTPFCPSLLSWFFLNNGCCEKRERVPETCRHRKSKHKRELFFRLWMLSIHIQIEAFVVQLKIAASLFSYVLQLSYTMLRVCTLWNCSWGLCCSLCKAIYISLKVLKMFGWEGFFHLMSIMKIEVPLNN